LWFWGVAAKFTLPISSSFCFLGLALKNRARRGKNFRYLAWLRTRLIGEGRRGERLLKEWFGERLAGEELMNENE